MFDKINQVSVHVTISISIYTLPLPSANPLLTYPHNGTATIYQAAQSVLCL